MTELNVEVDQLVRFLQETAVRTSRGRYGITPFPKAARVSDDVDLISLPVAVRGDDLDVADKVEILQNLEDAWNYNGVKQHQVMLIPASGSFEPATM